MMYKSLSDQQLVQLYISGKEAAISELLTRHKSKIFMNIFVMLKDHKLSEDIFQDTFVKVIKNIKEGKYNEEGKFISWAMRIAHNLVMDHFRKTSRKPIFKNTMDFDIFSIVGDASLDVESRIIKEQIHSDVMKVLQVLPEKQREVLVMRIYKDMSYKEIAENAGTSINTSLGRMRYALINLRKIVDQNNIILTK